MGSCSRKKFSVKDGRELCSNGQLPNYRQDRGMVPAEFLLPDSLITITNATSSGEVNKIPTDTMSVRAVTVSPYGRRGQGV